MSNLDDKTWDIYQSSNQQCAEWRREKDLQTMLTRMEELNTQKGNDDATKDILATAKPCPGCKMGINLYRGHGCHHIKCTACPTQFCYVCVTPYVKGRSGNWMRTCGCNGYCKEGFDCGCSPCPDCHIGSHCSHCQDKGMCEAALGSSKTGLVASTSTTSATSSAASTSTTAPSSSAAPQTLKLTCAYGRVFTYTGPVVKGKACGKGRMVYDDGEVYEGEVRENL